MIIIYVIFRYFWRKYVITSSLIPIKLISIGVDHNSSFILSLLKSLYNIVTTCSINLSSHLWLFSFTSNPIYIDCICYYNVQYMKLKNLVNFSAPKTNSIWLISIHWEISSVLKSYTYVNKFLLFLSSFRTDLSKFLIWNLAEAATTAQFLSGGSLVVKNPAYETKVPGPKHDEGRFFH